MTLLPINIQPGSQFYRFLAEENLYIEKEEQRNEIQSFIHYTSAPLNDNRHWELHLETFKRKQRSSFLTQSEKEFFRHISFADNNIHLISDSNTVIEKIKNLSAIQQKLNRELGRLSQYYTGRPAELAFTLWKKKYENEARLINSYLHYEFFGLLFAPFSPLNKSRIVRYILPDTQIKVEEFITTEDLPGQEKQIYIQARNSESSNPNVESPVIDQYSGYYIINTLTSRVRESQVQAQFSSKDYLKKINYQLKAIDYEEI